MKECQERQEDPSGTQKTLGNQLKRLDNSQPLGRAPCTTLFMGTGPQAPVESFTGKTKDRDSVERHLQTASHGHTRLNPSKLVGGARNSHRIVLLRRQRVAWGMLPPWLEMRACT